VINKISFLFVIQHSLSNDAKVTSTQFEPCHFFFFPKEDAYILSKIRKTNLGRCVPNTLGRRTFEAMVSFINHPFPAKATVS
jgi:hypothetical protein